MVNTLGRLPLWFKSHKKAVSAVAVAAVSCLIGTSVVSASIPDSNWVIHACRLIATSTVRIIDTASQSCTGLENEVTWKQKAQGYVNSFASADLTYADLRYRDFTFMSLSAANLMGANVSGADFGSADLSNANFDTVNSHHVNFVSANLTGTTFGGVFFYDSNFTGANLSGKDLTFAHFTGSNMTNANLSGATIFHVDLNSSAGHTTTLANTNFTDADLTEADFRGTNLSTATLTGVTWSNTTCPDETNSNDNSGTCIGHLTP